MRRPSVRRADPVPPRLWAFTSEHWAIGGQVVGGDSLGDRVARWCRAREQHADENGWPSGMLGLIVVNSRVKAWGRAVEWGAPRWRGHGVGADSGPADPDAPPDDHHRPVNV